MATIITAVIAADVELATGDIVLGLQGLSPKPYGMQIKRGIVGGLVATLMGLMQKSRERFKDLEGDGLRDFQPLVLTGMRRFQTQDGRLGTTLELENGLPLPVLVDPKVVPDLRTELEYIGQKSAAPRIH